MTRSKGERSFALEQEHVEGAVPVSVPVSAPAPDVYVIARQTADPLFVASLLTVKHGPTVLGISVLWTQLALAWCVALLGPYWLLPIAFVIICACQQAMLLWVHEASHANLARSRRWNDFSTDLLVATPVGMTVRAYRAAHSTHHAYLGSPLDRDRWAFSLDLRGSRLYKVLALGLAGYYGVNVTLRKYLRGILSRESDGEASFLELTRGYVATRSIMMASWNIALVLVCVVSGRWFLYAFLWIVPLLTVSILLNIVRSTAEHQPIGFDGLRNPKDSIEPVTRTTRPGWLEKWLLYQVNFNYHLEHHTWPRVPHFNLPRLHEHLRERGFYERHPECLQGSAWQRLSMLHRGETSSPT